jgi:hypothetical protein
VQELAVVITVPHVYKLHVSDSIVIDEVQFSKEVNLIPQRGMMCIDYRLCEQEVEDGARGGPRHSILRRVG